MRARKQNRKRGNPVRTSRMTAVRDDLDALHKDVRGLVSDVRGAAGREVRGAVDGAAGWVETWGQENLEGVRETVRSQPLTACALSIGAGAIIGALLLR
jgi:hypothetical protein